MSDRQKSHRCKDGTHVCGTREEIKPDSDDTVVNKVVNIAGNYAHSTGRSLDPKWSWIPDSGSHADVNRKGLRLELNGGKDPFDKRRGRKQQAVIELLCDDSVEGTEDFESETTLLDRNFPKLHRDHDDDDGDDDDDDKGPQGCEDNDAAGNRSLSFCSYGPEDDKEVLRLIWRTKYACRGAAEDGSRGDGSSHWGFFTWLIVIIFLGVAGYLIFGSWLNYSRYGARGWDLVPHGDTIRDIPYFIKDFCRNLSNIFTSDSRGGYSAV